MRTWQNVCEFKLRRTFKAQDSFAFPQRERWLSLSQKTSQISEHSIQCYFFHKIEIAELQKVTQDNPILSDIQRCRTKLEMVPSKES
jgi:hypothetical protein